MKRTRACLVINPRAGENLARLPDVIGVFAAAEWKTALAIKQFAGHSMELANEAASDGCDLVIAYGGDGTLNQVVNGVMAAKDHHAVVGVIPGGTANVWASEIGMPSDPVKAALTLVNSDARAVDVGYVEVESITFHTEPLAPGVPDARQPGVHANDVERTMHHASGRRHHFLLMAGLGIDAAIMARVRTSLKEKIGTAAVAIAAISQVPSHRAFPVELRSSEGDDSRRVIWKGEALQVVVGNTRRYANIGEATPEALIDDGLLDVCVITAGSPPSIISQIIAFIMRRQRRHPVSEFFRAAEFTVSAPASIAMQLDGSAVKLKDYVTNGDWAAMQHTGDRGSIIVNYRFRALAGALKAAFPRAYDDTLFEAGAHAGAHAGARPVAGEKDQRPHGASGSRHVELGAAGTAGLRVTVIASAPNPAVAGSRIVAGTARKKRNGDLKPVAVRIDDTTAITTPSGARVARPAAMAFAEGAEIVVEGRQSKRGVVHATRIVMSNGES